MQNLRIFSFLKVYINAAKYMVWSSAPIIIDL